MGKYSNVSNSRRSQSILTVTENILVLLVVSLTIPGSTISIYARSQENYNFVQEFAPGQQFSNPDITIDKQSGNIYIADYFSNRVIKFDPTGNVITQWGSPGSGDGQFANPQDVAINSAGFIYVPAQLASPTSFMALPLPSLNMSQSYPSNICMRSQVQC